MGRPRPTRGYWFLAALTALTAAAATSLADAPADMDRIAVKHGAWVIPEDADLSQPQWRQAMDQHRARQRRRFGAVRRPDELKMSFVEGFAFLFDRRLYDPTKRRWRAGPAPPRRPSTRRLDSDGSSGLDRTGGTSSSARFRRSTTMTDRT